MANIRIIEQPTITTLSGGEYLVTDSATAGTQKITPANLVAAAGGGGSGDGLTQEIKQALLQIAEKVVYVDEYGQDYYDDLYAALYATTAISLNINSATINTIGGTIQLTATTVPAGANVTWQSSDTSIATVSSSGLVTSEDYGNCTITATAGSVSATCSIAVSQVALSSISASYTQSGTVYNTDSLDSLKSDLVVTAIWSDTTQTTVASTDYTLSGILAAGTSVITVNYGGKTDTFNVTVTAAPTLSSISAVYTQSGTVYDTDSLDSLKPDLVVTATYSDTSTATVPSTDYALSGTLTSGTSTVTVTYENKTTTFTVTVTEANAPIYNWDFTQSLTDSVGNVTASLTGATRDSNGISFVGATDYASLGEVFGYNKTMVIELGTTVRNTSTWTDASTNGTNGIIFWVNSQISFGFGWNKTYQSFGFYSNGDSSNGTSVSNSSGWKQFPTFDDTNDMSNTTIKLTVSSAGVAHMFFNGTEVKPYFRDTTSQRWIGFLSESSCNTITLGSSTSSYPAFRDMIIKKLRIYSGEI